MMFHVTHNSPSISRSVHTLQSTQQRIGNSTGRGRKGINFPTWKLETENTCEVDNSVWGRHVFSPLPCVNTTSFEVCSDVCMDLISLLFSAKSNLQNADGCTQTLHIVN